ncbi:MAG: hypothetical protein DMG29_11595 [Acidobacteria bacterium]|nr:MAG: hypothetical protein DMG29_11595 [Acidobacteriota bacterium]
MTRLLERALAGLGQDAESRPGGPGALNHETQRLFAYHHATKHTYYSVRARAHFLDWRNQPSPFRVYRGARTIKLERNPSFPAVGTFEAMARLGEGGEGGRGSKGGKGAREGTQSAVRLDSVWLSRLLWYSMAISAWKQVPQSGIRYSLRVNPSSGNLHPTETHLALCGFDGLDDGLYHYRADTHALERRGRGDWVGELARALELDAAARLARPRLIVALTSIFWREAWKYRDRAYRYCCHDLGHAQMSILLAALALGHHGGVMAHFSDLRLARTLGLAQSDEAPMSFLVFSENSGDKAPPRAELESSTPNELSEEEVPYYLLLGMHRSTVLVRTKESEETSFGGFESFTSFTSSSPPTSASPTSPTAPDSPLGAVVRRRRSALDFDPQAEPMPRATLEQMLDLATRDWPADWRGNFVLGKKEEGEIKEVEGSTKKTWQGHDFIELYLYVHRVRGLEPGVYRWSARDRQLEQLHTGNVQRVAAYLSLEQPLAGHASFAISMIADLEAAARLFGNRGYRYVHFEAGAIGQRLYLGAEALGWNATGIGAFYDDDVHRYLGLLEETGAKLTESVYAAEQAAMVTLETQATTISGASPEVTISESHEEQARSTQTGAPGVTGAMPVERPSSGDASRDGRRLPRQVIYHFAVGRAVRDPRLGAAEE